MPQRHRLFYALWPDTGIRRQIIDCRNALPLTRGCRPMPVQNLHITLHFIGPVTTGDLDCLRSQAHGLSCQPFRLQLQSLGTFQRARILWMGMNTVPDQLLALHSRLGLKLKECDYEPSARYRPHVTLARHCSLPVPVLKTLRAQEFCIDWTVDKFVLVESVTDPAGAQYRILETYTF
jgi:2'-5' RNA ligase